MRTIAKTGNKNSTDTAWRVRGSKLHTGTGVRVRLFRLMKMAGKKNDVRKRERLREKRDSCEI